MPLTTSSTTHFSITPKLQPDYLNEVCQQQAVRHGLFAKGLALQPVPNQLPTRLINVKSQRPSPGTSAQLHASARNQLRGIPGRIVREVPKEVLPQALLSDAVAVRASLNSAVEGRNW